MSRTMADIADCRNVVSGFSANRERCRVSAETDSAAPGAATFGEWANASSGLQSTAIVCLPVESESSTVSSGLHPSMTCPQPFESGFLDCSATAAPRAATFGERTNASVGLHSSATIPQPVFLESMFLTPHEERRH